ncbi:glycyl-radical enzyme activating protein [Tissierella sp. MSJ-40]|uniref:Glycyl-radical enzyme activating protein n=1 Tax=Tissierella simiarum TaxID=2841534 RepID=A0ABS6E6C9_9FIRM|nr:trans-4-hydroxy-L-proline dehydratase activase [Tissierella simiarum]MBU5438478.1 glycyl-radical enzyme activating protein [Tissierella simiarum]
MTSGTIINIQKYSIHDGPGIRTTVFLKGCPLKCWWCHNPESQSYKQEIMFFEERCIKCKACEGKCQQQAIRINDSFPIVNRKKCILCGECANFCPNNAREYVGKNITVKDLMKEIQKDEIFYEESGGGVTFSGGEPMVQIDFLNEVLKNCKDMDIHTAVDTSGYTNWKNFNKIIDKVDLFLYDLKLMNNEKHLKYIGVPNNSILENLKKLSDIGANIFIRMPIIAGINDDNEHIIESIKFLSSLNIMQINLLPYHKMGMDKYKRLGLDYNLSGMEKPTDERMIEIANEFKSSGMKIKIGG